ncbi:hypothetical protein PGT05_012485 [Yersinia enterocolitica]|uniref:hypothetical protein n=1 Tax=Yersinia enterocolitica TaxID=630 RepID=UPI003C7CDE26
MEDFDEFERKVDVFFKKSKLTTENRFLALWRVLTVYEDNMFMCLYVMREDLYKNKDITHFLRYREELDKYKYSLKHTLELIYEKCQLLCDIEYDKYLGKENYQTLSQTRQKANAYSDISRNVISTHRNLTNFSIKNKEVSFKSKTEQEPYASLQYISVVGYDQSVTEDCISGIDVLVFLIMEMKRDNKFDFIFHTILTNSKVSNERVQYDFNIYALNSIFSLHSDKLIDMPDEWVFPWGDINDFRLYYRALSSICIYHLYCLWINGCVRHLKGAGVEQRVLDIPEDQLVAIIKKMTNLSEDIILKTTQYLTYGFKTKNPDPALQPLFKSPLGYFLPIHLILSSNYERNALSLHLRVNRITFDKTSYLFEKRMTDSFVSEINSLFPFITNFHLPNKSGGEIDVAILDEGSKTILLCELKWTLTPADQNEILQRQDESLRKISQAENKLSSAKGNIKFILDRFNVECNDVTQWKIRSFVIIDGFAGVKAPLDSDVVLFPIKVFFKLLYSCVSLDEFYHFSKTYEWLPQEPHHYKKLTYTHNFAGMTIKIEAMEMLNVINYFEHYLPVSLVRYRTGTVLLAPTN